MQGINDRYLAAENVDDAKWKTSAKNENDAGFQARRH